jgi:TetR/AcrR family transcriptional repressor of nem operon
LPASAVTESAARILDVAQKLAQTCGFNGFSYADIAAQLGVTRASLHYHFPSKAELGRELVARYRLRFEEALEAIGRSGAGPADQLRRYMDLYHQVVLDERICLCGMFAAEYATLPAPMQEELRAFFDGNQAWLAGLLQEGLAAGAFRLRDAPAAHARVILSALEGAMLVARVQGDAGSFRAVADQLLASL